MNFNETAAVQANAMDKQYIGQQNFQNAGLAAGPMETLSSIQQDSIKCAYELCSMLDSIGDALGGSVPQNGDKATAPNMSIKSTASELRALLHRALAASQRIGSHL